MHSKASEERLNVADIRRLQESMFYLNVLRKGSPKGSEDYKPGLTSLIGMTNANIIVNHTLQPAQELLSVIETQQNL